jgi:ABC-type transport system involved in cytochrome c biogenesis permease subunit
MTRKPDLPAPEHREAVRLDWMSMHIPVGAILLSTLLLSGIFSAASMVWGYGPVNSIP